MNNAAGVCPTWKLTAPPGCYGDRQQPQRAQRVRFRSLLSARVFGWGVWVRIGGNFMDTNGGSHTTCSERIISEKVQKKWTFGSFKIHVILEKRNTDWTSTGEKGKLYTELILGHAKACQFLPDRRIWTCGSSSTSPSCMKYSRTDTGETVMDFRIINLVQYTFFISCHFLIRKKLCVNSSTQLIFLRAVITVSHAVRDAPADYYITAYFKCETITGTCLS